MIKAIMTRPTKGVPIAVSPRPAIMRASTASQLKKSGVTTPRSVSPSVRNKKREKKIMTKAMNVARTEKYTD